LAARHGAELIVTLSNDAWFAAGERGTLVATHPHRPHRAP